MSMSLRHEILQRKLDRQKEVRLMKSNMAKSVLLRISEELSDDPDVKTFRTPLLIDSKLARYQLRSHPDEIAGRLALNRTVEIALDETVKPPEVVITLGPIHEAE